MVRIVDEWIGNLILNGSATEGTRWWETEGVSVISPGCDDDFCFQIESGGTMMQIADAEKWATNAERMRFQVCFKGSHEYSIVPDCILIIQLKLSTNINDYIYILMTNTQQWQSINVDYNIPEGVVPKEIVFTVQANRSTAIDKLGCMKSFYRSEQDIIQDTDIGAYIESKRAIFAPETIFHFKSEYTRSPVICVSLTYDFFGEQKTINHLKMSPQIELLTRLEAGILYYYGAKVTWIGNNIPDEIEGAYTNIIAIYMR